MAQLERISYEEAREWFWIRTSLWFVPAFLASAVAYFVYAGSEIATLKARVTISILCGLGVALLGLVAAIISIQFPWMRLGRRRLWWFNTLVCAAIAGFGALGASAIILTLLRENPDNVLKSRVIETAHYLMAAGIAASGFWGAAFGAWFALRRDKFFVESI